LVLACGSVRGGPEGPELTHRGDAARKKRGGPQGPELTQRGDAARKTREEPPGCSNEPLAEKTFYEAQHLLQNKRYWEAAPTFVMSYNHCAHAQVLCAAGHAYHKSKNCLKSAEVIQRCLADPGLPQPARARGLQLKGDAQRCLASQSQAASEATVASSGDRDVSSDEAEVPDPEDAVWIGAKWTEVGGSPP